jgi:hypothetical protein
MMWTETGADTFRRWTCSDLPGITVQPWGAGFAALLVRYPDPPRVEVRATLIEAMWAAEHMVDRPADLRGLAARVAMPEPAPRPGSKPVTPSLVSTLRGFGMHEQADDVEARAVFGQAKYGTDLTADNGRDHVVDLRQELADALQYAQAAVMAGRRDEAVAVVEAYCEALRVVVGAGG